MNKSGQTGRTRVHSAKTLVQCLECEIIWQAGRRNTKYCGQKCASRSYYRNSVASGNSAKYAAKAKFRNPAICQLCGKNFTAPQASPKFCSISCSQTASRSIIGNHRALYSRRRRARIAERFREKIDPITVFERDNWICYLCKTPTLPDSRGSCHPLAPEVDHILPISKGGIEAYSNVACAHRKCNLKKRDLLIGDVAWADAE